MSAEAELCRSRAARARAQLALAADEAERASLSVVAQNWENLARQLDEPVRPRERASWTPWIAQDDVA